MSRPVALTLLLLVSPASQACEVLLSNASRVDLALAAEGRTVLIGPGESRRVHLSSLGAIEFGAESHAFDVESAASILCPAEGKGEVEARADGKLWLRSEKQPDGRLLAPIDVHDLTRSPPNNSSTPAPLRGSA